MKLIDLNLLIYAIDEGAEAHEPARRWLADLFSSAERVGLPWVVLSGFVRLSTRAAAFSTPMSPGEAMDVVDGWLAEPNVSVIHPGYGHAAILRDLLKGTGTAGNLVTDAHLAALAIEHGAELLSRDSDFGRFPGLRWRNPLS